MLGLVEPQSSGLGGGAFLIHYDAATGKVTAYDGRETAPASATPELFYEDGKPLPFIDAVLSGRSTGRLVSTAPRPGTFCATSPVDSRLTSPTP